MNLLVCLVLAAVATTTTYGQAPAAPGAARSNELLDGLKVLSDLVTDKNSRVVYGHHYLRDD